VRVKSVYASAVLYPVGAHAEALAALCNTKTLTLRALRLAPARANAMNGPVTIHVEKLDEDVAMQLAQFCKRISFACCFELTEEHLGYDQRQERAYMMLPASTK
jgi:hypothetical protein